ncbi:ectonucleoside triphosphate diphosphohydrolase 5-like [Liolophura sinensis]|uniref:ectonucleoside triphosphate diphosphohydrolase 5-like n=1 Tax=Liolophura sinensis TaxID=3198878 RepID=UPI0031598A87
MLKTISTKSPSIPTMLKQYLSRGRFVIFLTILAVMALYVLHHQSCFLSSGSGTQRPKAFHNLAQDEMMVKSGLHTPAIEQHIFYGIMFDAGSTGSRIHVFQFMQDSYDSPIKLMNETFEAIKPGLSYYRQQPSEGAKSLVPLLDLALTKIPLAKRKKTPVALKATAGLRLLPGNQAEVILNQVHSVIRSYPFRSQNDSVQIMDGSDEGIFSWMTVNFLLGSLTGKNKMVAALDLGGGSTQITLVPNDPVTYEKAPKDFLTNVKLFGTNYRLYTHSYLGLGLMSARFQIMGGKEHATTVEHDAQTQTLTSNCLPRSYDGTFEHQGIKFPVKRSSRGGGFERCYSSVKKLITSRDYSVDKVEELKTQPVYIFSYYYDRAVESGLIDEGNGGEIHLIDYQTKANSICGQPIEKMPYLCMDLVYMYSLLHDGFGLPDNKHLYLKKKIAGVEISWALGAMFDMLSVDSGETS